jgi:hypothetical protein
VADSLRNPLRPVAGTAHERDRGVPEVVDVQAVEDGRRVLLELLLLAPAGRLRGQLRACARESATQAQCQSDRMVRILVVP